MCRVLLWKSQKGYMQFDGEKASYKSERDSAVWHIVGYDTVGVEFFSKLFSVSGIGAHGVRPGGIFSAFVVSP